MFVALQQNAFIKSNLNVTCIIIYLKFKNTKLNTNMVKHVFLIILIYQKNAVIFLVYLLLIYDNLFLKYPNLIGMLKASLEIYYDT